MLAADTSRAGYANDEAVMLYRRALDHAGSAAPAEPEEVARVAEALADVYVLSARYSAAVEAYQHSRRANRASISRRGADAPQDRLGAANARAGCPRPCGGIHGRPTRIIDLPDGPERSLEEAETALSRAAPSTARAAIGRAPTSPEWPHRRPRLPTIRSAGPRVQHPRVASASRATRRRDLGAEGSGDVPGSGDLVGEANVLNNLGVQAYYSGRWSGRCDYYGSAGNSGARPVTRR